MHDPCGIIMQVSPSVWNYVYTVVTKLMHLKKLKLSSLSGTSLHMRIYWEWLVAPIYFAIFINITQTMELTKFQPPVHACVELIHNYVDKK